MTDYEQRIAQAIATPSKYVAPHLRTVHVADLKLLLSKIKRLEKRAALADEKLNKLKLAIKSKTCKTK